MLLGIDASQANREIRSGTEWYAFYLIEEFKKILGGKKDINVVLYTNRPLRDDLARDLPKNFNVKVLRWLFPYFWTQGRLSWEMLVNPPDILFCPAHTIPALARKRTVAGPRPKIFTTIHDLGFEDYPELYDKLSLWYHRLAVRLAIKRAYHIFTVSQFSKQRIIDVFDYPEEKITVTYLGIDRNVAAASFESIAMKYDLKDKGYFLYIGRLEPKKNILNMIKGYEQYLMSLRASLRNPNEIASSPLGFARGALSTVEMAQTPIPAADDGTGHAPRNDEPIFVLAGRKVRTADVDEYLAKNPGLAEKVKFLDFVSEEEKNALYSGAKALLFATYYEGFGLPILEAQAAGAPVITSNTASNAEIAGKGALIVDPGVPYDIAQAIKKINSDTQLVAEKVKLGLENAKKFTWEKTALKTLKQLK